MAPIPLDFLPQEILARIAGSGPAESVLALAKTCRTLYRACYDTLVFKAVIEGQRPLWKESKMLDVPTLSRYIGPEDTQAWARFAVADQRAMEFRDRVGPSDEIQVMSSEYINLCNNYVREGFESWAPYLFVARRKSSQIQRAKAAEQFVCRAARVLEGRDGLLF
jgi:hypothetical protein